MTFYVTIFFCELLFLSHWKNFVTYVGMLYWKHLYCAHVFICKTIFNWNQLFVFGIKLKQLGKWVQGKSCWYFLCINKICLIHKFFKCKVFLLFNFNFELNSIKEVAIMMLNISNDKINLFQYKVKLVVFPLYNSYL